MPVRSAHRSRLIELLSKWIENFWPSLHSAAAGCILPVSPELEMEIRYASPYAILISSRSYLVRIATFLFMILLGSAAASTRAASAQADTHAAELFEKHCAACHDNAASHAPGREALADVPPVIIFEALEHGAMMEQAVSLTTAERRMMAEFLTGKPLPSTTEKVAEAPAGQCESPRAFAVKPGEPEWNGWGRGPENRRLQTAAGAGLSPADVSRLKLKWAFGFPGNTSAFSQPTVVGGRVFTGSADGTVYSLDAQTGCSYWRFRASAGVRVAISVTTLPGSRRYAAFFGDLEGKVYAVDAATGEALWSTQVDAHPQARITGAPTYHDGRLYVPVSSHEEGSGVDPKYHCCTFRGSVVALEAATGKQIWKTYTIQEPPHPTTLNAIGVQLWGPSGGGVWSAPTLDLKRRAVYVGTGDGYSDPRPGTLDSIMAFDMDSGKIRWVRQTTANDAAGVACYSGDKTNCPKDPGPDFDYGSSPILVQTKGGRSLLVAGQKSGIAYAFDPDAQGRIVWQARVGEGGNSGGVQWGPAADANNMYVAVSDLKIIGKKIKTAAGERMIADEDPLHGGGLWALRLDTGAPVWHVMPPPGACEGRAPCSPAQSAAVTVIPGAVFSGSVDGHLRVYSAADGEILWDLDTQKPYTTVNGVAAKGGSLDGPGPTVVGGILYVNSGYSAIMGKAGNVLLAFSVDGK